MAMCLGLLLLFPLASYILNGGLYMRAKAFIPFLPLLCYLAAAFFGYFRRGIIARWKLLSGYALAVCILVWGSMGNGVADGQGQCSTWIFWYVAFCSWQA